MRVSQNSVTTYEATRILLDSGVYLDYHNPIREVCTSVSEATGILLDTGVYLDYQNPIRIVCTSVSEATRIPLSSVAGFRSTQFPDIVDYLDLIKSFLIINRYGKLIFICDIYEKQIQKKWLYLICGHTEPLVWQGLCAMLKKTNKKEEIQA